MFFIYLLAFFAFNFFALFFGKNVAMVGSDLYKTLLVFQFIFLIVFSATFIIAVIQQLSLYTRLTEYVEELKRHKAEITLAENKHKELSVYFEKYLGSDFPKFEKEILTTISQKPEKLLAIFQTYPELQSSVTLSKLMDHIRKLVENIYDKKHDMEYTRCHIRKIITCPWLLIKPKQDIDKI